MWMIEHDSLNVYHMEYWQGNRPPGVFSNALATTARINWTTYSGCNISVATIDMTTGWIPYRGC